MATWHETLAARLLLRLGGGTLLSAAWFVGSRLYSSVHAHPPRAATPAELGLCALLLLLLVTGNALLFVGAGLWQQVAVPGRWSAGLIEPRLFELFRQEEPAPLQHMK
ncbi:MAG: hypothetical protein J7530_10520 [Novosphingobium sp.]|nr:hypothetical protein [Novosphingobium sp.]